jgi:lysozyme
MHISSNGLLLIERFEGFSSHAYWDSYGRVWTIGFGQTEGITGYTRPISRAQGTANLRHLVEERYEPAIRNLGVDFNQNQWDALCSFVWNLGPGILEGSLGEQLKAHDFQAFADSMLAYDRAGGVVLQGLKTRREAERALFLQPAVLSWAYVPADEVSWEIAFDNLRGKRTALANIRRALLVRKMTARRKLIWRLAERGGWKIENRYNRYLALRARTGG